MSSGRSRRDDRKRGGGGGGGGGRNRYRYVSLIRFKIRIPIDGTELLTNKTETKPKNNMVMEIFKFYFLQIDTILYNFDFSSFVLSFDLISQIFKSNFFFRFIITILLSIRLERQCCVRALLPIPIAECQSSFRQKKKMFISWCDLVISSAYVPCKNKHLLFFLYTKNESNQIKSN